MKKLILLICFMFILTSCVQDTALDQPKNVFYQEDAVHWDLVDNATSYTVLLNDVSHTVSTPIFNMSNYPNGDYQVSIRAHRDDLSSVFSDRLSFVVDRIFDHPTSLAIQEQMMSWQPIDNANSYIVLINGVEYPVTDAFIDLSFLEDNITYELYVMAVFDLGNSSYSSIINYLPYYDVISSYKSIYNINTSYDLEVWLRDAYVVNHISYNNILLNINHYAMVGNVLNINAEFLHNFDLGEHLVKLYTSIGVIDISIEIIDDEKPLMISTNLVEYVIGQDIELIFEVFDGSFESLSGHDIQESDYSFEDGVLTIFREYLDPKIATFEGSTIIYNYRLRFGDNITLGYIFIRIS